MRYNLKRMTALLLSIAMCMGVIGSNAWAADQKLSGNMFSAQGGYESPQVENFLIEGMEADEGEGTTYSEDVPGEEGVHSSEDASELAIQSIESGECGRDVNWTLDNGTLTISGSGPMDDFPYAGAPWQTWSLRSSISHIVIEPGVTRIGNYSFFICTALLDVSIPDTVQSIGEYAFSDCYALAAVEIPGSVKTLGKAVFNKCSALHEVSIPSSVKEIPVGAFYSTGLRGITLPSDVQTIGSEAFERSRLIEVDFQGSLAQWNSVSIASNNDVVKQAVVHTGDEPAFTGASGDCGENAHWTLDSSGRLTISGTGAMADYSSTGNGRDHPWVQVRRYVKEICIEDGITRVGDCAFNDCFRAQSVTIAEGVTSLGESALSNLNITTLTLPGSVTKVGGSLLACCPLLKTVQLPASLTEIPEKCFHDCKSLGRIVLPEKLTKIGDSAFLGCQAMPSITIPASVTFITQNSFNGTYLTMMEFEGDIPQLGSDNVFVAPVRCRSAYYESFKGYFLKNNVKVPLYTGAEPASLSSTSVQLSLEHPKEVIKVSPAGGSVHWTSDAPDCVSVDENGTVSASGHGYAIIRAEVKGVEDFTLLSCAVQSSRNDLLVALLPKQLQVAPPVYCNAFNGRPERVDGYQMSMFVEHDTSNETYQDILRQVKEITVNCSTSREKAIAIQKWVTKNVEYGGYIGIGNSIDQVYATYQSRKGHCEGIAKLTGFMLYLAGIPNGICANNGHMWNIALTEKGWMMVDSTFGESDFDPNDKDHSAMYYIAFGEGDCCMVISNTQGIKLAGVGENTLAEVRKSITVVSVPEYVTGISQGAFYGCNGLKVLSLPHSVKTIDDPFYSDYKGVKELRFGGTAQEWSEVKMTGKVQSLKRLKPIYGSFDVYIRNPGVKKAVLASYDTQGKMCVCSIAEVSGPICRFELGDDSLAQIRFFQLDEQGRPVCESSTIDERGAVQ